MRAHKIFTEDLPVIGEVPMCFFIPDCPEKKDMEKYIVQHGGRVTDAHECFTRQI